jgi:hypothetical protein
MTTNTHDLTARARALLDGITPGEWRIEASGSRPGYINGYHTIRGQSLISVASVPPIKYDDAAPEHHAQLVSRQQANAAFIAAAPGLVRDLLARVEQLERGLLPFALMIPSSSYADDDELTIAPIGPNYIAPVVTIGALRAANAAFHGDTPDDQD